jgi:hypothetical protein
VSHIPWNTPSGKTIAIDTYHPAQDMPVDHALFTIDLKKYRAQTSHLRIAQTKRIACLTSRFRSIDRGFTLKSTSPDSGNQGVLKRE